jgi:hypothetical protein
VLLVLGVLLVLSALVVPDVVTSPVLELFGAGGSNSCVARERFNSLVLCMVGILYSETV